MSKLGRVIGFSAEAGIWIAGAALIASAAGMHWSVDLPKVDLSGLIPANSAVASDGPGTGASSSGTPAAPKTPMVSAAEGLRAFFAAPDVELEATVILKMTAMLKGTILNGTQIINLVYKAGDGGETVRTSFNGTTFKYDAWCLGDTTYVRDNTGVWAKRGRNQNDLKPITIYFVGRAFTDKGVETKGKQQLHRVEVTDGAAFNADYARYNGVSNTHMALVYWVDDTGQPVTFSLSGTYTQVDQGVLESFQIEGDWTVTKTSGVTITAPI